MIGVRLIARRIVHAFRKRAPKATALGSQPDDPLFWCPGAAQNNKLSDHDGKTLLEILAEMGVPDVVAALSATNAGTGTTARTFVNWTILRTGIIWGDFRKAIRMVRDYDTNEVLSILPQLTTGQMSNEDKEHRKTLLHWAAECGSEVVVKRCLQLNASVKAKDKYGETALHYAAENGYFDTVQLLVDAKSDLAAQDKRQRTPLECAQNGSAQEKSLQDPSARGEDSKDESLGGDRKSYAKVIEILLSRSSEHPF